MVVLARKRSETLLIDGTIRVEVLGLSGGMARLRFLAPTRIPISRGVARHAQTCAMEAINAGADVSGVDLVGMRAVDLLLGTTQVLTVGREIHIGLVDIDSSRALLFIDAPHDVSVQTGETETPKRRRPSRAAKNRGQAMLPFPPTPSAETDGVERDPRGAATDCAQDDAHPGTVPFRRPEN